MDLDDMLGFLSDNRESLRERMFEASSRMMDVAEKQAKVLGAFKRVDVLSTNIDKTFHYIQMYHEYFGQIPPDELIVPLYEAAKKRGDTHYLMNLDLLLKEMREKDTKHGKLLNSEQRKELEDLLNRFEAHPEDFQGDINRIYPVDASRDLDKALIEVAKNSMLTQRWVVEQMEQAKGQLKKAFEDRSTRDMIFNHHLGFFMDLYTANAVNNLILDARYKGDIFAVIRIYQLIRGSYESGLRDTFPPDIEARVSKMALDERSLAYLRWRMMDIAHSKHGDQPHFITESILRIPPLYNLAFSQMLLALSPFVNEEERSGMPMHIPSLIGDLMKVVQLKPFHDRTSADKINKLFWYKIDVEIPRVIKDTPKFQIFAPLTKAKLEMLLQPKQIEMQISDEQGFVNFSEDDEDKEDEGPAASPAPSQPSKSRSQKKKDRRKKAAQKKKAAKEKLKSEEPGEKQEEESVPSEIPGDEGNVSESELSAEVKESGNSQAPSAIMKTEEEKEALDNLVNTVVDQAEVDREVAELIREQQEMIEKYRVMKKVQRDHSALYTKNIKVGDLTMMSTKKKRMVAFLRTDDFRLLSNAANTVYLDNELKKTGQFVANNSGSMKFQWVFNPEVVIDRDTFLFLCQVFNVIGSPNHLSYQNFLNAFVALNPSKVKRSKRAAKCPNRTVFQFSNVIETDDVIYIPPIGGVHPEHLSSRFNLKQAHKFLMHGGAHPYFFRMIRQ